MTDTQKGDEIPQQVFDGQGMAGGKSWYLLYPSLFATRLAVTRPLRVDYPHAYYHVTCRHRDRS